MLREKLLQLEKEREGTREAGGFHVDIVTLLLCRVIVTNSSKSTGPERSNDCVYQHAQGIYELHNSSLIYPEYILLCKPVLRDSFVAPPVFVPDVVLPPFPQQQLSSVKPSPYATTTKGQFLPGGGRTKSHP